MSNLKKDITKIKKALIGFKKGSKKSDNLNNDVFMSYLSPITNETKRKKTYYPLKCSRNHGSISYKRANYITILDEKEEQTDINYLITEMTINHKNDFGEQETFDFDKSKREIKEFNNIKKNKFCSSKYLNYNRTLVNHRSSKSKNFQSESKQSLLEKVMQRNRIDKKLSNKIISIKNLVNINYEEYREIIGKPKSSKFLTFKELCNKPKSKDPFSKTYRDSFAKKKVKSSGNLNDAMNKNKSVESKYFHTSMQSVEKFKIKVKHVEINL